MSTSSWILTRILGGEFYRHPHRTNMDLGVLERSSYLPKVTQLVSGAKMPSQECLPCGKLPLVTVCIALCSPLPHSLWSVPELLGSTECAGSDAVCLLKPQKGKRPCVFCLVLLQCPFWPQRLRKKADFLKLACWRDPI